SGSRATSTTNCLVVESRSASRRRLCRYAPSIETLCGAAFGVRESAYEARGRKLRRASEGFGALPRARPHRWQAKDRCVGSAGGRGRGGSERLPGREEHVGATGGRDGCRVR